MNKQEIEKAMQEFRIWYKSGFSKSKTPSSGSIVAAMLCMEQQLNGGWIPVTDDDEHHPEAFTKVIFTDGDEIYIGCCDPNYEWSSTNGEDSISIDIVTAWQPLPENYKEVSDAERN